MMVTFVSQCEKNALKKTRRVLDAFADRIGDNTWQTIITEDGLLTVKKMLRQTASKSTAVSCHWIRSRARSQFLWVVGNKLKFNEQGVVPVNSTKRNLMNGEVESDWKYLPLIKALVAMSGLLHDWGKASQLFQEKLKPSSKNKFKGDPLRHEWVSVLLLNALVHEKVDEAWLNELITAGADEAKIKEAVKNRNLTPLSKLPDAAKLIAWLIVSHHRLPNFSHNLEDTRNKWIGVPSETIDVLLNRITQEWGYENKQDEAEYNKRVNQCIEFPNGLLSEANEWCKQIKRWAASLKNNLNLLDAAMKDGSYRVVLHHARLCLMLGDHFYSSQDAAQNWQSSIDLFANTDRATSELKQKLDEHLVGVAKSALHTAHLLPAFEQKPPSASDIKMLGRPSPAAFKWQDKAVSRINEWQAKQDKQTNGFFAVNMASTGCGKTFANAKIMRALSVDKKSLRYILALGLRTLTLQTGDEYRDKIGLTKSDLAVLIGSKAVAELHNLRDIHKDEVTEEILGSESAEALLDEFVVYDCDIPEEGLSTVLTDEKDKQFLYAPVLACTIDHMMAATETKRGGRYILPSLRLMSSDLVIDEIDDFTGDDLIAIGRLIHLAGMLGRKVMISSATIPPSLALGYFNCYKKGWQVYSSSRDKAKNEIGCAWVDEFTTHVYSVKVKESEIANAQYQSYHDQFINKRVAKLNNQIAKRKAKIIPCPLLHEFSVTLGSNAEDSKRAHYFSIVKQATLDMHQSQHSVDAQTGIRVSFGVVRVANISPCVDLTKFLLEDSQSTDTQIKVMAYHSQQVLLLRHEQEKHLDAVLKRKEKLGEPLKAFSNPIIRQHLDSFAKSNMTKNVVFILVATPVEEVGRDHDFDWAIIEPSSYRSIVQLAGRVRRHRAEATELPNIGIMQYNLKAFIDDDQDGKRYFIRPGYEDSWGQSLPFHNLTKLINEEAIGSNLNAIPRIKKMPQAAGQILAAVEHVVTAKALANFNSSGAETMQGYLTGTWYLTALPQFLTPFRKSEPSINLYLFFNEQNESCYFTEKDDGGKALIDMNNRIINRENILNIKKISLTKTQEQNLWLSRNYYQLLTNHLSEPWLTTLGRVSMRYGELNLPKRENTLYEYNDQFGLVKVNMKGGL